MKTIMLHCAQPVMAAGFQTVLAQLQDFTLSAVCSDPADLMRRVPAECPDVLLIELAPSITLELLRNLATLAPRTAVILWVDTISVEFVSQAIAAGVRGVLRKTLSIELQAKCVTKVGNGEYWVEKNLSDRLLIADRVMLTPRERQLIGLLAQGLKNKEMAFALGITEGTVKVYLSRLFHKVGANDRFELALFALRNLNHGHEPAAATTDGAVPRVMSRGLHVPAFISVEHSPARMH